MDEFFAGIDFAMREATLFAACGFLLLGASDLAIDLIWIWRTCWRRLTIYRRFTRAQADRLGNPERPGRIAVFVPAWEEAGVIRNMLENATARFDHPDYAIYVGCYPNDPATIAAVRKVEDPRVRLVIGPRPGPTTKADCLNAIWRAMLEDEAGIMYQMHQATSARRHLRWAGYEASASFCGGWVSVLSAAGSSAFDYGRPPSAACDQ